MTRAKTPRRSGWLRAGVGCGLALLLGVALGRSWPAGERAAWGAGEHGADAAVTARAPVMAPVSFADVVERARPGIVSVRAEIAAARAEERDERGAYGRPVFEAEPGFRCGSGFVVDARGLVVTSRHIVAGATAIEVIVPQERLADGRRALGGRFVAAVAGEDEAADLAVLRLEAPPPNLAELPLGPSEALRAGDWIVAVGNPYGFTQTVTAGVVSFVGRHLPHTDLAVTSDFLQISAPVNPGSSGCPVLDLAGRVVGVTTQAAAHAQGISFAVPSRTLQWALAEMAKSPDGVVRRGYLGIEFATSAEVDDRGSPRGGAEIVRVVDGAPAEAAGIRRGDIVLAVDGVPVADATVLHERIVRGAPGARIALQVLREDRILGPIEATLSAMRTPDPVN